MIYDVTIKNGEARTFFTIDNCETLKAAFDQINKQTDHSDNVSGVIIEINVR